MDNLTKTVETGFAEMRKQFGVMNERFDTVDIRLVAVERDISKIKGTLVDVQEEVASINFALENDAKRYFDHEKRITKLEKAVA